MSIYGDAMLTDTRDPIRLDDYRADAWQRFIAPCPEHGRACGPWCEVLWDYPTMRPLRAPEPLIRRAIGVPRARDGGAER